MYAKIKIILKVYFILLNHLPLNDLTMVDSIHLTILEILNHDQLNTEAKTHWIQSF